MISSSNIKLNLYFLIFFFGLISQKNIFATDAKKIDKQTKKCCNIGVAYTSGQGYVILEKMCNETKLTTFYFRTSNLATCCTYAPATNLYDEKGRKYNLIDYKGLPSCIETVIQTPSNHKFKWSFEKLKSKSNRISIIESPDPATEGMGHWSWRNLDIRQCKF